MKTDMERGVDQRHFTRMEIDAPADILTLAPEPRQISGVCRDVSAGGMLLETKQPITPGATAQVTLRSHYGDKTMLSCKARVVRADPDADGRFIIGFEILEFLD